MAFDKHDRAHSILKEMIATYIRHEANTNPLITVTNLDISPDYKRVAVLFTTIPDDREADALIWLQRHGGELRTYLKKHGAFKRIPHFDFRVDYGERHRQHIDEVVRDLNL